MIFNRYDQYDFEKRVKEAFEKEFTKALTKRTSHQKSKDLWHAYGGKGEPPYRINGTELKAGMVINLIDSCEQQDFLVRKIDKDRMFHLSPVRFDRVADLVVKFTSSELDKFSPSVNPATEDDLRKQQSQVMDHGPVITVQSYYEQYE